MKHLLCLGDSLTDCERLYSPDGLGYGYVHQLHTSLNQRKPWTVTNRGVNGFTLNRVLESLPHSDPDQKPDVVTVLVGINDVGLWMANPSIPLFHQTARFRLNLTRLLKLLTGDPACAVCMLEPFVFPHPAEYWNWFEPLAAISQITEELCGEYHAGFLPLHRAMNDLARQVGYPVLTTDGIHLTAAGHRILAAKLMEYLESKEYL